MFIRIILEINCPDEPNRDKSKCPAIKLAVNRTAKVIGRIDILINSIITIKGINNVGVPIGVRWVSKLFK